MPKIFKSDAGPYIMQRTIVFEGEKFEEGEAVDFNDKGIEGLFIKNNYVKV